MSEIDRLIAALVGSDVPLDRQRLQRHADHVKPDVAPLATPDTVAGAVDAVVGLGPLERLLADENVSDVLVNGPDEVWIDRGGLLERVDVAFRDDEDVVAMVRRVIAPLGLRIDRAEPAVDARLADGSRLHAVIAPASVSGPTVAIRRFHPALSSLDDLVASGGATDDVARDLRAAVTRRDNVLVAGPTGAGKTTLLNILCADVPDSERIVTIEDAAELQLTGHVVRLETRRANVEGVGDVTMRDLVRHALRLRPDRIIVGEVRGPEALDMLQALNTGHHGSMSTIHANGAAEALVRLGSLAAMASDGLARSAVSELVASAIDVVVTVARTDGLRRVSEIRRVDSAEDAER